MNDKLNRLWATKTKNDEWWSSFVTAPLAVTLNYFVVDIRWLTPNRVTLFSFIVGIAAVVYIILGGFVNFVIAAILIQFSHILDCMDGQIARYRNLSSRSGGYFDKVSDQIQVILWFGAIGYAGYVQSNNVLPVILAFAGVAFYSMRGYSKYVAIYSKLNYYKEKTRKKSGKIEIAGEKESNAGLGFSFLANLRWFIREQRKILAFDEGVFIFMLSFALIFNVIIPMLWIFAVTQIYYGLYRSWQRGQQLQINQEITIKK